MPTVGKIGNTILCSCKFVKENQHHKLFDEHGLDVGLYRAGNKTHQGCRLTKIRVFADIGSAHMGSMYADANLQQLVQVMGMTWHNLKLGRRTI